VLPVYDEPGCERRMLIYRNDIDNVDIGYPLVNPTVFGQPLVLRVIQGAPGDEWLRVQAPVRPHGQSVWVRADGLELSATTKRIEVDLAEIPQLTLYDGDGELVESLAVTGRGARPTLLHDTYIDQIFRGATLSPAYGTYIFTMASYSEVLGTFGGAGLPGQSIYGTNQPELIGQRVSSGGIRVPNEVIEEMFEQPGMLGANVLIYDSTGFGRLEAIERQRLRRWTPALTTTFLNSRFSGDAAPVTSYS